MFELLLLAALGPGTPLCAQTPRFVAGDVGPAPAAGLIFRGDKRQLEVLAGGRRLARLRALPGGFSIDGQDPQGGFQVLATERGWEVGSAYGPIGRIEGRRASFGELDWVLQDDQAWSARGPGPRVHNPNPARPAGGAEALFLLIPGLSSAEAEGLLRYIACTGILPLTRPAATSDQTFLLSPFIGDGFWIGRRPGGLRYGADPAHPEGRLRSGPRGLQVLASDGALRAQTRSVAGGFVVQDGAGRTQLRVRQGPHRFELSRPGEAVFAIVQGDRADLGPHRALVRDRRLFQRRELAQLRTSPGLPADELALLYHASGLTRAGQAALLGELVFRQRRRQPLDPSPLSYRDPRRHLELIPLAGDRYRLQRRNPGSTSDPRPDDLNTERFVLVRPDGLRLQTATGQTLARSSRRDRRWTLRDRRGHPLRALQAGDGGWQLLDRRGHPLGRLPRQTSRPERRALTCLRQAHAAPPSGPPHRPAEAPPDATDACEPLRAALPGLNEAQAELLIATTLLRPDLQ